MASKQVTDESFDHEVLQNKGIVLVDFWAEWCGPCKQISPILEEISEEMGEKISVAKVNIDDNMKSPTRFNVRGIPTMILFKNGQALSTKVGAMAKNKIVSWIEENLEA